MNVAWRLSSTGAKGHEQEEFTDDASTGDLRFHQRQDSESGIRPDSARDRHGLQDQVPKRRDVPSQSARKEGADHSRSAHVSGDSDLRAADENESSAGRANRR